MLTRKAAFIRKKKSRGGSNGSWQLEVVKEVSLSGCLSRSVLTENTEREAFAFFLATSPAARAAKENKTLVNALSPVFCTILRLYSLPLRAVLSVWEGLGRTNTR
ncbi:unnamed protein product [Urochloa humidicola]